MAARQYIGARYVPIIGGDWDNTKTYEPLVVVYYEGASYTSRTYVPVGIDISNTIYWALSADYNAQVAYYRQEVLRLQENFTDFETLINSYFITPDLFGAAGDGVTDDLAAFNDAIDALSDGQTLFIPNKSYLVSNTIEIDKNINILCMGTIIPDHAHPVFTFDSVVNGDIYINNIEKASRVFDYVEGTVDYSIGVLLINCDGCTLRANSIKNVTTGVVLLAENSEGCHYNNINCNDVHSFTGIEFIRSNTGGWVNGNIVEHFRWMVNTWSDNTNNVPSVMIKSLSYTKTGESEPYVNNGNTFNSLVAEYGAAAADYEINLIALDYARGYLFNFDRVEILAKSSGLYAHGIKMTNSRYNLVNVWFSISQIQWDVNDNHNIIVEKPQYEKVSYPLTRGITSTVTLHENLDYTQYWFYVVIEPFTQKCKIMGELNVNDDIPANTILISGLPKGLAGRNHMSYIIGNDTTMWNPTGNITHYKVNGGGQNTTTLSTRDAIPSGTHLYVEYEYYIDSSELSF